MEKLIVQDLHKSFGSNEVLRGVTLRAAAGDVISIIGSSGSGKSTLLRCINLLELPDAGRIVIDGQELKLRRDRSGRLSVSDPQELRKLRTRFAMVFQHFNLWMHLTALENIIEAPVHVLGRPRHVAVGRARELLQTVGLSPAVENMFPAHLSGGQQQRVAIARALAMDPEVMLFDEPTSALDPERVGEVLKVMQQLAAEGRTMIVVTHEMTFARHVSNRVLFLHEGRVEEEGRPSEVLVRPRTERLRQFLAGAARPADA